MGKRQGDIGRSGFTLIELSIVLVIIGLIVGGVLAGQNLIAAAAVRAQITQIEKYNTAANTFHEKFGYLPGDIPASLVTQFGFTAAPTRAGTQCRGDGNGLVQPWGYGAGIPGYTYSVGGENAFFWEDLSTNTNLIEGGFTFSSDGSYPGTITASNIGLVIPQAKIGNGNFINVFAFNTYNYYELANITQIAYNATTASVGITVQQAYSIDKKTDDGLPQSGNVLAIYSGTLQNGITWAGGLTDGGVPYTTATAASSTSCFDNGGASGTMAYSVEVNGGAGVNCALSFRFQ